MAFDANVLPVPDLGLRCLACGYPLAGLPEHRCPECGRPFTPDEHIPPGDFPCVILSGREVAFTPDVAELCRTYHVAAIEMWGPIETTLGLPVLSRRHGRLAVSRHQYFEVIDLLRRSALGEPMPAPPAATKADGEWRCPRCGEAVPGGFELCWNCGADGPLIPAVRNGGGTS